MFTQKERSQLDKVVNSGFVDSFRLFNEDDGNYTWWPNGFNARKRNIGWRIDYIFTTKNLKNKISKTFILNNVFGSDHCPVGVILK